MKRSFYGLRRVILPSIYFGTGMYVGFGATSLMLLAMAINLRSTTLPKAYFTSCFLFPFACWYVNNKLPRDCFSSYYSQYSLPRNICIKFLRKIVNIRYPDTTCGLYKKIDNIDPRAGGFEYLRMYKVSGQEIAFLYPYCRFVGFQVGVLAAAYAGIKVYSWMKKHSYA